MASESSERELTLVHSYVSDPSHVWLDLYYAGRGLHFNALKSSPYYPTRATQEAEQESEINKARGEKEKIQKSANSVHTFSKFIQFFQNVLFLYKIIRKHGYINLESAFTESKNRNDGIFSAVSEEEMALFMRYNALLRKTKEPVFQAKSVGSFQNKLSFDATYCFQSSWDANCLSHVGRKLIREKSYLQGSFDPEAYLWSYSDVKHEANLQGRVQEWSATK